jgi:O-antigen/teichoic acid export membrane protein
MKNNKSRTARLIFAFLLVMILAMFMVVPVFAQGETPPIALPPITAVTLVTIIASLVSLMLDYFPGLAAKYDALSVATKRQIAAVLAVVIVGVVFGLTCTNIVTSNLTCSTAGAWDAISNIIYVFVIGQGVHAGTKPTAAFKKEVLNIPAK